LVRDGTFWTAVNSNFLDVGVLEWCKLLADPKDPHCYAKIVADVMLFENDLFTLLRVTPEDWRRYREAVRAYRDKFIAHLDSKLVMRIPKLDLAVKSVSFYHSYVVKTEGNAEVLLGMPPDPRQFYQACRRDAAVGYAMRAERQSNVRLERPGGMRERRNRE